jgi:hypothetical protein
MSLRKAYAMEALQTSTYSNVIWQCLFATYEI